ncbi:MAG: thiamine ABC transporter substrate-binding protein [Chloroflexi bacterium HGW-Chloroflexi-8]|nr:MAG: thiamine ABC transporter substrate-binding protein [Chloroflexi bacterium HGW-Chloroflexi-8]
MKNNQKYLLIFISLLMVLNACQVRSTPISNQNVMPKVLNVMTHDSFSVSESIISEFEKQNNVKVNFLLSGDTGAALNRAILTKNSPQADVFYGTDNTFMSRALSENIFEPYKSDELININDDLELDKSYRLLPVDYGDVCINYDKKFFSENKLSLPESLSDLVNPEYKGLLVVENPATSSPGLSFLMATIAEFGNNGYLDYWKKLKENDVVVVNDWETAYYTNFSASSGKGNQPLVVSYNTSPAAEVIFSDHPLTDSPTSSIISENSCFRQIEFVGILSGTHERALAEKFVDFMLSQTFQEDLPLQMFVYPANVKATLPEEFTKFISVPQKPASLDPELIAKEREVWINAWTDEVLR